MKDPWSSKVLQVRNSPWILQAYPVSIFRAGSWGLAENFLGRKTSSQAIPLNFWQAEFHPWCSSGLLVQAPLAPISDRSHG